MVTALAVLHPAAAPSARLVELVWGSQAPASATKSLHNHVSRIRRAAPGLIIADPHGYRLGADVEVDLRSSSPSDRPLADLPDLPETAVHRERFRLLAVEHDEAAYQALAASPPSPETIEALHRAVVDEPYRERRWWLLARSQAAAGQRRDALLTLDAARRQLGEVGLDLGHQLIELERSILAGDAVTAGRPGPAHALIHPHRNDPFVGRTDELELLTRLWEQTCDTASPQAVLVVGPAGMGKTRLVDEFCRRVEGGNSHARVLWGRHRRDAGRALGAITEAIERAVTHEPDLLAADDPLRVLLGTGSIDQEPGAELARTRLGRALTRFVSRLATRPTIWLFDDAQWASPDSSALLHEALDGAPGPLLLIATLRPEHSAPAFGEIGRSVGLNTIELDPLERADVGLLVSDQISGPIDDAKVDVLHHRTGGLPLYASELARAAAAAGSLDVDALPAAIREWLNHRISTLDGWLVELLHAAAIAGQTVDLDVVAAIVGRSLADTADGIDQLVARGFLVVEPRSTTVSFSHALTREIVADSIGPMARRGGHVAVAEAMVALRPTDQADIARHFDLAGDRRAHAHAMIAGARGLAIGAWSHASELFGTAVRTADTPTEQARALVGQGRAELGAGNATAASDSLLGAVDLARRHDDPIVHARAVLHLVGRAGRGAITGDEAMRLQLLRAALDHVERHDSNGDDAVVAALQCDLERELAIAMLLTGQHDARRRLLRSAVERAEQLDPPNTSTYAHALLGYRYARLGPLDLPERLADLDRIDRLPRHELDPEARVAAEIYRCEDLLRANRPNDARNALAAADVALTDYPDPYWIWAARTWTAIIDVVDGDLERAEARSEAALADRASFVEAHICRTVNLVGIRLYEGRVGEMIDVLQTAVATQPHIPTFRAVLALCAGEIGDTELAREHLRWFTDTGARNLPLDTNRFLGLNALAHAAWQIDDREAAAVLRDLVEPYDRQWVVLSCFGGGGATWGPVSLALAGLATTLGQAVTARSYLERAALEAAHAPLVRAQVRTMQARLDAA